MCGELHYVVHGSPRGEKCVRPLVSVPATDISTQGINIFITKCPEISSFAVGFYDF